MFGLVDELQELRQELERTRAKLNQCELELKTRTIEINASYWSEKLQHGNHGGRDGAKVFDEELFRKRILERLDDHDLGDEEKAFVKQRIEEEIFSESGEHFLLHAAYEFRCCLHTACKAIDYCISRDLHRRDHFYFDSSDLPDGKDYSYHFLWCLYAVVWGIQQYDAVKVPLAEVTRG